MHTHYIRRQVKADLVGFNNLNQLISIASQNQTISINFSLCKWFEGQMCATLGALIEFIRSYGIDINIDKDTISEGISDVFKKNGFWSMYCDKEEKFDTYGTTIHYKKFDSTESASKSYADYILKEFIGNGGLPGYSQKDKALLTGQVCEIFDNATRHSDSKFKVFTCGQYYPSDARGEIIFSIADLGVGFKQRVSEALRSQIYDDYSSIAWAIQKGNTSRVDTPGGLGLHRLCDFVNTRGGLITIVSGFGFWRSVDTKAPSKAKLDHAFPGAIVLLKLNAHNTL